MRALDRTEPGAFGRSLGDNDLSDAPLLETGLVPGAVMASFRDGL